MTSAASTKAYSSREDVLKIPGAQLARSGAPDHKTRGGSTSRHRHGTSSTLDPRDNLRIGLFHCWVRAGIFKLTGFTS